MQLKAPSKAKQNSKLDLLIQICKSRGYAKKIVPKVLPKIPGLKSKEFSEYNACYLEYTLKVCFIFVSLVYSNQ